MPDQGNCDSGLLRGARTRRQEDPFRAHGLYLFRRYLVIAAHLNPRAQFAEILHQVVSERIVIIEDENHSLYRQAYTKVVPPRIARGRGPVGTGASSTRKARSGC